MTDTTLSLADATAQMTAPGQIFEMGTATIRGQELRVWTHAPATLRVVLDLSLNHAQKDFLVYEDERVTFDRHYRLSSTMATRLLGLGVAPGDRVAVAMRNLPEWVVAFWSAIGAGGVAVPLNAWWTGEELSYGLGDSGSRVLFCDIERLERLEGHMEGLEFLTDVIVVAEDRRKAIELPDRLGFARVHAFAELLGEVADDAAPPDVAIDPDDDATIFYTSGTTGRPKGAVGTHRNACTNLMNLFFIGQRGMLRFTDPTDPPQSVQNSFLLSVPLFHATGCLASMVVNTAAGGKLVMMHHLSLIHI